MNTYKNIKNQAFDIVSICEILINEEVITKPELKNIIDLCGLTVRVLNDIVYYRTGFSTARAYIDALAVEV